jgi:hypothetical protein
MIKLENYETLGWEHAIRGMRNPMNSWDKSDSGICVYGACLDCEDKDECRYIYSDNTSYGYCLGKNDYKLMMKLRNAGTDHRKFMRMIVVYVDITAPLYWWKEFDTYKVGTTANSCSTMHKIHAKEFTRDDFSCEDLTLMHGPDFPLGSCSSIDPLDNTIRFLNEYRIRHNNATDPEWKKRYFRQMIQLLPSSYNQKRTVMLNYEVLANIYKSRKNHKLDEWRELCKWIEELPYSELITGEKDETSLRAPVSYKYSVSVNGKHIEGYTTVPENPTDDEIRRAILDTICDGLSYAKN